MKPSVSENGGRQHVFTMYHVPYSVDRLLFVMSQMYAVRKVKLGKWTVIPPTQNPRRILTSTSCLCGSFHLQLKHQPRLLPSFPQTAGAEAVLSKIDTDNLSYLVFKLFNYISRKSLC